MIIERKELANKLKAIKSAIPKPKESGVFGVLYDNGTLIADNYKMRIEAKLYVQQSLTDDKFILPYKAIELIENLSSSTIDISYTDKQITVKSGNSITNFAALSLKDFPEQPKIDEENEISVDAEEFSRSISKVLYAADGVGIYSGVLLKDIPGIGIDLVGCDGSRLAKNHIPGNNYKINTVVPKECVKKVLQLGIRGNWQIVQSKSRIVFKSEDYKIFTQLLSGSYIDYTKVLNIAGEGYSATVNRQQFAEIVKRVCLLTDRQPLVIKKKDENTMILSVNTSNIDFDEEIEYTGQLKDGLIVGFNALFMESAVHEFESETITLIMETNATPCSIIEGDYHALVLPVRLKKEVV